MTAAGFLRGGSGPLWRSFRRGLIMIRFVRTAGIAPGRQGDSVIFAKQIVDYIGKNFGVKFEVMLPIGGNPNRIAWRTEYTNLSAFEDLVTRSTADPKYMELVKSGAANFIAGSVQDSIWRTL
jgi:hypothetical protein